MIHKGIFGAAFLPPPAEAGVSCGEFDEGYNENMDSEPEDMEGTQVFTEAEDRDSRQEDARSVAEEDTDTKEELSVVPELHDSPELTESPELPDSLEFAE